MNAKIALTSIVLAAGFAGSAYAESPTMLKEQFVSSKTRADVQADLAAYRKAGVNPWSTQYNPLRGFQGVTTREAAISQYIASRNEVKALGGEDSGSAYLAQQRSPSVASSTVAGQARNAQ